MPNAGQFCANCQPKKGDKFLNIFFEEYFVILASDMIEQTRLGLLFLMEHYLKTHRNTVTWQLQASTR
jgi:hypothetical protein